MVHERLAQVLGIMFLAWLASLTLAAANEGGELSLAFKGEGKVKAWGFSFDHTVSVSSDTLLKGGKEALKAIFKDAEVTGDDAKIEEVTGEFKIDTDGTIAGKVKLEWKASGNPKSLEADLAGKATLDDSGKKVVAISFKSENGKVAGSWSHGKGQSMKTSGTGSFTVESKKADPQGGPETGDK